MGYAPALRAWSLEDRHAKSGTLVIFSVRQVKADSVHRFRWCLPQDHRIHADSAGRPISTSWHPFTFVVVRIISLRAAQFSGQLDADFVLQGEYKLAHRRNGTIPPREYETKTR